MYLKQNGIVDMDTWFAKAPPRAGEKHWKDGRSAKELARYMTGCYPNLPCEMEAALSQFTTADTAFDWQAEYVTDLAKYGLGQGEGRNHDAFLFGAHLVVGIEGKADEPFGSQYVTDAWENGSNNKKRRIDGMLPMLYGHGVTGENAPHIRYQLLTASAATLLEAGEHHAETSVLLVIVCKKPGCYAEEKIQQNHRDITDFLESVSAGECDGYYAVDTPYGREHGIRFCFRELVIELPV